MQSSTGDNMSNIKIGHSIICMCHLIIILAIRLPCLTMHEANTKKKKKKNVNITTKVQVVYRFYIYFT